MNLSALVRLLRVMNWGALPDGKNMRHAVILAILARLQESEPERALRVSQE